MRGIPNDPLIMPSTADLLALFEAVYDGSILTTQAAKRLEHMLETGDTFAETVRRLGWHDPT